MADLYRYGHYQALTAPQLFVVVAVEETCSDFGVTDATGVAFVLLGQNWLPTRAKPLGATKGTSVASRFFRLTLDYYFNRKILPTITAGSVKRLKIIMVKNLGVFVGRSVPVLGWAMTGVDAVRIMFRTVSRYNALVRPEDRIL
ncbi:hypothetical protein JOE11_004971 [Robbsia andropogonis]|uniref:STM2901 family protein n=1 Tax=Robbsia andropogonis TaxID=28092 RepID=UPI003D23D960